MFDTKDDTTESFHTKDESKAEIKAAAKMKEECAEAMDDADAKDDSEAPPPSAPPASTSPDPFAYSATPSPYQLAMEVRACEPLRTSEVLNIRS